MIFSRTKIPDPKRTRSRRVKRMWNILWHSQSTDRVTVIRPQLKRSTSQDRHIRQDCRPSSKHRMRKYLLREYCLSSKRSCSGSLWTLSTFLWVLLSVLPLICHICFSHGVNPPHGGNITNISVSNLYKYFTIMINAAHA